MTETWDEEIIYLDDPYKVKYHSDGSKTLHCPKNKRGFEITIHKGGTVEERRLAADAVKSFFINNIL